MVAVEEEGEEMGEGGVERGEKVGGGMLCFVVVGLWYGVLWGFGMGNGGDGCMCMYEVFRKGREGKESEVSRVDLTYVCIPICTLRRYLGTYVRRFSKYNEPAKSRREANRKEEGKNKYEARRILLLLTDEPGFCRGGDLAWYLCGCAYRPVTSTVYLLVTTYLLRYAYNARPFVLISPETVLIARDSKYQPLKSKTNPTKESKRWIDAYVLTVNRGSSIRIYSLEYSLVDLLTQRVKACIHR